jgi:hypothetical protein
VVVVVVVVGSSLPGGGVPVEDGPVEFVAGVGSMGAGAGTSSSSSVNFMSSAAPTTPTATAVATPMPPDEPAEPDADSALTELARGKINNNAIARFFILNITGSYLLKLINIYSIIYNDTHDIQIIFRILY